MSAVAATAENGMDTIKGWLLERKPELADIDLDLDLIESRVIDSLGFLDFVYFLEEVTGRELTSTSESVHVFRTLRSIQDNILEQGSAR